MSEKKGKKHCEAYIADHDSCVHCEWPEGTEVNCDDFVAMPEDPAAKLCLRYSTELAMCEECCWPQANVGGFGAVAKSCQFHVAPHAHAHTHDPVDHEHSISAIAGLGDRLYTSFGPGIAVDPIGADGPDAPFVITLDGKPYPEGDAATVYTCAKCAHNVQGKPGKCEECGSTEWHPVTPWDGSALAGGKPEVKGGATTWDATEGLCFPDGRPLTPSEIGVIDGDGSGRCLRCGRPTIAQHPKCVVCKAWPFVCFDCTDKLEKEDRSARAEKAEGSAAELLNTLGFERQESGRLADRVRELESHLTDSERTQEAMAENVRKANAKVLRSRNELMARKVKKAGRDALERRALRTRAREAEARVKELKEGRDLSGKAFARLTKYLASKHLGYPGQQSTVAAVEAIEELQARVKELEKDKSNAEWQESFWTKRCEKAEASVASHEASIASHRASIKAIRSERDEANERAFKAETLAKELGLGNTNAELKRVRKMVSALSIFLSATDRIVEGRETSEAPVVAMEVIEALERKVGALEKDFEGTEAELIRLANLAEKDEAFWRDRGQRAEARAKALEEDLRDAQARVIYRVGDVRNDNDGTEVAVLRWEKVEEPTP